MGKKSVNAYVIGGEADFLVEFAEKS